MTDRDPADGAIFFSSPAEFRTWLADHHDSVDEQWVGFWKKATGVPSLTWPESVDQALCYGWIDGLRKSVDEQRYKIRFTPRRRESIWSAVNLKRVPELIDAGLMEPPGLAVYEGRDPERSAKYSFEREAAELGAEQVRVFRANRKAWAFFQSQPPGYRKLVAHWVTSAKREDTRAKRLQRLIEDSAAGQRIKELRR